MSFKKKHDFVLGLINNNLALQVLIKCEFTKNKKIKTFMLDALLTGTCLH